MLDLSTVRWRKSTFSGAGGNCVEVAPTADGVIIRLSKHPAAGTITFSHAAWAAFVREAHDGASSPNGVAIITKIGTDTLITSLTTKVELRFDADEWSASSPELPTAVRPRQPTRHRLIRTWGGNEMGHVAA